MAGALHQFVRTLEPSAVGRHVLEVQRLATEVLGRPSTVFAESVHPAWEGQGRASTDYGAAVPARPDDVLVYHHAVGSRLADVLAARTETLVVDHHNVTPPAFFAGWDPEIAYECAWGVHQVRALAGRAALGIGDSPFNEAELVEAGYRATASAPILVDLAPFAGLAGDREPGLHAEWLFVGRVTPNKAQHDLVSALAAYRRLYDPRARLTLVGDPSPARYGTALDQHIAALGLDGAVRVLKGLSREGLFDSYRAADVLVCLSDHEGFGVPVLEAIAAGVPVVAYASTAVPDTLGGAGLMLDTKDPVRVAAAVHRVVTDGAVRRALVKAGAARAAESGLEPARRRWVEVLRGAGLAG